MIQGEDLPQNANDQQHTEATNAPNFVPTQQMASTHAPDPHKTFFDPDVPNALEQVKSRRRESREFQDMVELVTKCVGDYHRIDMYSPPEMYSKSVRDSIPFVELLQIFSNGWLDISIIRWFAM